MDSEAAASIVTNATMDFLCSVHRYTIVYCNSLQSLHWSSRVAVDAGHDGIGGVLLSAAFHIFRGHWMVKPDSDVTLVEEGLTLHIFVC